MGKWVGVLGWYERGNCCGMGQEWDEVNIVNICVVIKLDD